MACRCREPLAVRGYSIIEVLGAATIFIVGLAGLTQGLATLRTADARADRLAIMSQIALTWVDRAARADPGTPLFSAVCGSGGACDVVEGAPRRSCLVDETGEPVREGGFVVTWHVIPDVPRPGVRRIDFEVADTSGLSSSFVVQTHVR